MNILILDNSVGFTGAFKCALNEADMLSGEHKFIFAVPTGSTTARQLKEKNYTVYTLPFREISRSLTAIAVYPFFLLKNLIALKKIIKKEQIDVIQVNDFYNLLGAAAKATGFKGKLLTYVRFLPSAMPGFLTKIWLSAAMKYADKIIGVSDAVRRQLPAGDKCTRIYDPIKLAEQYPMPTAENETTVLMLYLANFTRGKGQDKAIEAFQKAYNKNNKLRLKLAGGNLGKTKNDAFKDELMQIVQLRGLSDVISFEDFTTDIERAIKSSDIILNFSEGESFSMTCLEAAFYGTALIATRCGGPEEIICDQKTGLLVTVGDVEQMSEAILKLAGDKALRMQYSTAGKEYVRQKFNIENFKQQFQAILR